MSIHVNSLATLNVTVATDSTKLPLTGGTMSGAIEGIITNTPTELLGNVRIGGNLSLDYGNSFAITATNTYFQEGELRVSSSESADYTSLTIEGLRFADGTIQTTAANGEGGGGSDPTKLPLTGGNMTGDIIWNAVETGSDSAIGTFGFGTENVTLGQFAYIEPQAIAITGSDDPENPTTYLTTVTITKDGISRTGYEPESGFSLNNDGVSCGNQTENGISFTIANGLSGTNNSDSGYGIGLSGAGGNLANGSTFGLNTFGVGGNNDDPNGSWGFDCNGLGGYNGDGNPSDTSFSLNASKVSGHIDTYVDPYTEETVPAKDWEFGVDGAKFIDGTIQTTAGIPEAPIDGNAYVRKDGAWVDITTL